LLLVDRAVVLLYPYSTLKWSMRQLRWLMLCLAAAVALGQPPAEAISARRIERAKQDLQKIKVLVEAGALPRLRLGEAEQAVADAEDQAILDRAMTGDSERPDDVMAAARRRLDRQQARLDQARRLVDDGIEAPWTLTPLASELSLRQSDLELARSYERLEAERAELAQMEESIARAEEAARGGSTEVPLQGMEHYEGARDFDAGRDLKSLAAAFASRFDHPLPVSAEGETSLHRALGFDHRGRVDVALDPNEPEGVWLRDYLKARDIPYYAFTRAVPGKSTAAHIHIGPGSARLHAAD